MHGCMVWSQYLGLLLSGTSFSGISRYPMPVIVPNFPVVLQAIRAAGFLLRVLIAWHQIAWGLPSGLNM